MARLFDWLDLVHREHIEHIDRGPNVKRGEINIKCPFCGNADPSFHMGLSLTTGFWACWRNKAAHSGKSPVRLLMKLARVPFWKARQMAGLDEEYVDPEGFDAAVARIMGRDLDIERVEQVRKDFLALPREFDLISGRGRSRRHFDYLEWTRGFDQFTADLIDEYTLLFANHGDFTDRVILPYITNGELVSWSGRAIGNATLRYRDLSLSECLIHPKENLYNHDAVIEGGKALVVVEGPIDALKIDFFGKGWGVRSVGLSTNSMSEEQIYLIEEASSNFDEVVFMMDSASVLGVVDSMVLRSRITHIKNCKIMGVPFGRKDAGAFTTLEAAKFVVSLGGGREVQSLLCF